MQDLKQIVAGNLHRFRKGCSLSVEGLAERVGVTRQTIHNYEAAKTLPDGRMLSVLARTLGVTLDDLLRRSVDVPNFRFRAHASFAKKPQFAAQVVRMLEEYAALERAVGVAPYTPESTPCHWVDDETKERIEEVAAQFRRRMDLGDGPIVNLFDAAEGLGLKVLRKPIPLDKFFGLSAASADEGAFILVNNQDITIERQLFTLAHEIGHLIFHRGEYSDALMDHGDKEEEERREKVADYFASHLLVPRDAFERALGGTRSLRELKYHFRVSYQVILVRIAERGGPGYGELFRNLAMKYKRQTGKSLTKKTEIEPCLREEEFPENERFKRLVLQALELEKLTELRAAELLGKTVSELRLTRLNAQEHVTL
jgi:Zn-dependent peptidase ImmA (M78 family)/DNA-binding XRE family transcriptional regulator